MRLFLETADLDDVRWAVGAGLIEGVSTNPSLLARGDTDEDYRNRLERICEMLRGPVCAQVISVDADGMYREGKELARLSDQVVIEVPIIEEGLIATRRLVSDGIRVNLTLVFSAAQALLAAKAGAAFVSPFVGRLDDAGGDGLRLVHEIREIFDNFSIECEILASSIQHARQLIEVARIGADAASLPPAVLRQLAVHPLTDVGLDQLLNDWSKRIAKSRAGA